MLIFENMDTVEKRDRNYAIGVICFAFILGLGSLWTGWWIIPVVLLIMLYAWNWRWALLSLWRLPGLSFLIKQKN